MLLKDVIKDEKEPSLYAAAMHEMAEESRQKGAWYCFVVDLNQALTLLQEYMVEIYSLHLQKSTTRRSMRVYLRRRSRHLKISISSTSQRKSIRIG